MPSGRSVEATQEIDASDVLEVIQVVREDPCSSPSLIGVGFDLDAGRRDETCQIRLAARRRFLSRYVLGAVGVSCLILVASLVKRMTGDRSGRPTAASHALPPSTTYAAAAIPLAHPPPAPEAASPASQRVFTSSLPDTSAADTPATGSIRFAPPAKAGWVWLDGKRLTATSAIVSCGAHQVKIGYRAKHAAMVPCGGEIVLSR